MAAAESVVSVRDLRKKYGPAEALAGVSLDVERGETAGLIGPDGAGKTTLMRILCGLLLADSGSASVLGFDCGGQDRRVKEHLGYMPQRFSLYPDLTVAENIRFFADLFGVSSADLADRRKRLMEFSGLGPFLERRAGHLSGGMKQKLALCCTLVHTPRVLVLDEPTVGVDVVSRSEFWAILAGLAKEGMALLVSTPYMDEAARFDRVVLLHKGRAIGAGTPAEVTRLARRRLLRVSGPDASKAWLLLREARVAGVNALRFGDRLHVAHESDEAEQALRASLAGLDVAVERALPDIEDTFVELMGSGQEASHDLGA